MGGIHSTPQPPGGWASPRHADRCVTLATCTLYLEGVHSVRAFPGRTRTGCVGRGVIQAGTPFAMADTSQQQVRVRQLVATWRVRSAARGCAQGC